MSAKKNYLSKTIDGANFYASNRSFHEFVCDSLRDLGVSDASTLPFFESTTEKEAVLEMIEIKERIESLQDLAYEVQAHELILTTEELSPAQERYHRSFIKKNEHKVAEYKSATLKPSQTLQAKIHNLQRLAYKLSPTPWAPTNSPRPDLLPLISGHISYLQEEKLRLESEVISTSQDISGFSEEFLESIINRSKNIPTWARLSFREQWARNIPPYTTSGGAFLSARQMIISNSDNRKVKFSENTSSSNTCSSLQASQGTAPPSAATHLFGGEDSDLESEDNSRFKRN